MIRHMFAVPAIVLLAAAPIESGAEAPLPDTPAGRYASAFLNAYNSADAGELERYNSRYGRKTAPQAGSTCMRDRPADARPSRAAGPNEIVVLLSPSMATASGVEGEIDPADP